jgi:hypothetical protein
MLPEGGLERVTPNYMKLSTPVATGNPHECESHPAFSVEESLALLRAIFPNYPDLNQIKPIPDLKRLLETYRTASSKVA